MSDDWIGTVRIKMFDGVVKDLTDVRYVSQDEEEHHLSWSCVVERAQDDVGK